MVGWMMGNDMATMRRLGSGSFSVDTAGVGLIEDLPAKVRLRAERVDLSSGRVLQFEQFHPKAGLITLSTTSRVPLRACPGGWRGKTPGAVWTSLRCVDVDPGETAVLPDSGNDYTHLSLAIRPASRSAGTIDVDLRYTAVDTAFECFLGGRDQSCDLLPPLMAN